MQDVHIDRALTNMSVAYMQSADVFIAGKVFPIIPVQKQSDVYFSYSKDDFFRDDAQERAAGTESAGGDYEINQEPPYYCRVYAYHKDVTEQERINSDNPLNPDKDAQEFVSHKLLLRRENIWVQNYFKSGVWGTEIEGHESQQDATHCLKWTNPLSDPIKTIRNARTAMCEKTAYKPNILVLSPYAYDALCDHEMVLDRIKYTQKGMVSKDLLCSLFEVDDILVPYAVQNTKVKGQSGALEFIMGKHALLVYAPSAPGIKKPSGGYTFAWKGLKGAGAYGNRVVRIPMPWLGMDTERIEGEMAFDQKLVCADMGVFFKDIV